MYIGQLTGLQYKKEISLTSTVHAGNLPYANKTNKLRKTEYIIVKSIEISYLQYDQLWVVMKDWYVVAPYLVVA